MLAVIETGIVFRTVPGLFNSIGVRMKAHVTDGWLTDPWWAETISLIPGPQRDECEELPECYKVLHDNPTQACIGSAWAVPEGHVSGY